MAVAGDSAGGNLSAVISILARDRGRPKISYQALIYPGVDFIRDWPSYETNGDGYFLTRRDLEYFRDHYLNGLDDRSDERASPLAARDLAGLPATLVVTAEFDPLVDQGRAYVEALQRGGVPVTALHYDGMIHGFWGMEGVIGRAAEAMEEIAANLRRALGATPPAVS